MIKPEKWIVYDPDKTDIVFKIRTPLKGLAPREENHNLFDFSHLLFASFLLSGIVIKSCN